MFDNIRFFDGFSDEESFIDIKTLEAPDQDPQDIEIDELPLIALRNTVLFPGVVIPIAVGSDKSMRAVKEAHKHSNMIGILSQRKTVTEDPLPDEDRKIGTV